MESFEELFLRYRGAVERMVFYRLSSKTDAEDLLQEIWLIAQQSFSSLRQREAFRGWILTIAKNKCNEYFRRKAKRMELPLEEVEELLLPSFCPEPLDDPVGDTLLRLREKDRQILHLAYFCDFPQADIAKRLGIPLGTVKSRLSTARERFREAYPCPPKTKGVLPMKNLPNILPAYTITPVNDLPFAVCHEELPGMYIVPRLGETITFGSYDYPEKVLVDWYHLEAVSEVVLHGVHGIQIRSTFEDLSGTKEERTIFAQLTENFCRYLGGISTDAAGIPHITTFLDEDFAESYAIGEENCGFEVHRVPRGKITAQSNQLSTTETGDVSDIVGRFLVEIDGKTYDTVRLIDLQNSGDSAMLVEYYLDAHGRTVLWRRYNRDDWNLERYGQRWTEKLPDSDRIILNGEIFVHWYDCLSDYIR